MHTVIGSVFQSFSQTKCTNMKTANDKSVSLKVLAVVLVAGCLTNRCCVQVASGQGTSNPIVESSTHFDEVDGLVAVEAEHFFKQELKEVRAFYLTHADETPKFEPDGDPVHVAGASNGAYLEILPDTRRDHGDKLVPGVNFTNDPGKAAVVSYKVNFKNVGRYYVWVRAYSTGSEDNGLHVGIDGTWPESGKRLQWCQGKHRWWWESKQRTKEVHCGVPHQIFLDVTTPGEHTIHFSMREDGFEFDKWLMTLDRDFQRPAGGGPVSTSNADDLPAFKLIDAPPFPVKPSAKDVGQKASTEAKLKAKEKAGLRDRSTKPISPVGK